MSVTNVSRWCCDWCGAVETTANTIEQPEGWAGLVVTEPPLVAYDEFVREHLCPTCVKYLRMARPLAAVASRRQRGE